MSAPASVLRFGHEAMSTAFSVAVAGLDEDEARQAAAAVFREVDRIERILSRFDPGSDIGRINRLRPGQSLRIGVETVECLRTAEEVHRETGGAFDVRFRSAAMLGWEIVAAAGGFEIRFGAGAAWGDDPPPPPVDIDPGGIGKGYALEKAAAVLSEWEVERALLDAGTSTVLAVGPGPFGESNGWPAGVGGPWAGRGVPGTVLLRDMALSGSGTEVKGAHVFDPRTGAPAGGHIAAWAAHRSAAVADALSTAFMAMTTAEVEAFCARRPDVWALVVADGGRASVFNGEILSEVR
ncbi:MAG: FAD:protein FMN transferase [Candidatus Aminicenantes bacterium]|nr:FAD:protein FMN transferase [Candidatus Aminicenantes bacterium]